MTRLLLIGTGLIGGSFALAMRRSGCFQSIVGYDADASALARSQARGIIDQAITDPVAEAARASAVMIAVPTDAVAGLVRRLVAAIGSRSIPVFDTGSVKGSVIAALRNSGGMPAQYVPTHPMAGSERHGPDAADPDLFRGRRVIVTAQVETDPAALARVREWWVAAGAVVVDASAEIHDEMVALTSHLPHLVAYTYMDWLARARSANPGIFAGPGLRDFSRIAASDPTMWRQIFAANRTVLLQEFDGLLQALVEARDLLRDNRLDELEALLERARAARAGLLERADD
jgi:prephenate dehydrogenase